MEFAFVTGASGGQAMRRAASSAVASEFVCAAAVARRASAARPQRQARWTMGKQAAFGPFSPIVIAARLVIGEKRFNKLRGKGISLHSQAITNFCDYVGAGGKTKQGIIRLAKTNGNTLGFLS
eukprot:CAMPEP_0185832080 /NCGR_PEP_ID=MMETSP1353-20130828/1878_1 /TAXON_ID=1077150 /ORGANISM="Erythrolobus australicus, Strain CCMP3124" /LENGTH=122 /DNA_ID=CAMNT_0028530219 /DNA_START=1 /DNA_END=369 /DNA_ORIENTATION=-